MNHPGAIHLRFWDDGSQRVCPLPARTGFVMPTDMSGVVFVGRDKEIGTLDLNTGAWETWATIPDMNPRTTINDGEIVPGGRAIVFGTKDIRFAEPIAHLFLFTLVDRKIQVLADKQLCSNGKYFSRSGNDWLLYDIDTPKRNLVRYRFDLAKRQLGAAEVVLDLQNVEGFPDGMVDVGDGTAIIAFFNPSRGGNGRASRYHLESCEIVEEWTTTGSPRVTCPLLVERENKVQLVLTTAVEGMPEEMRRKCPEAGSLFIADTTLGGVPADELLHLQAPG
ncbi:MAG: SMP-30/gluconolactonase/LRE family protein [Planctomycetes bacterium]|nr:SMP-30/gluconolactonase/LRE family protein [Planctomycetota bacterium]